MNDEIGATLSIFFAQIYFAFVFFNSSHFTTQEHCKIPKHWLYYFYRSIVPYHASPAFFVA